MKNKITKADGDNLSFKHDGQCLKAGKYSRDKWVWKCKCGHEWEASYNSVRNGSWCPNCKHKKITIEKLKEYAKSLDGYVLSNYVKNIFTKITWKCKYGHEWQAIPSNIIYHNKWCPYCSGNKKLNISDALNVARDRGAILISTEYKNSGSKLDWVCEAGHNFSMSLNDIRSRGHWCPYCKSWNCEEICRFVFEKIFNLKFNKIRPKWLRNDSGHCLELDGYSSGPFLGRYIAFEHNGLQHYVDNYLPSDLEKTKYHDKLKVDLCKRNNVVLFVIPHLFKILKLKDLSSEIKKQAMSNGIVLDINEFNINDLKDVYYLSNKLSKYNDIAKVKGGEILSDVYVNSIEKLKVKCKNDHIFMISASAIKYGKWCPICETKKI